MTKTIALVALSAAWIAITGCEPETLPNEPVAEGLPQNEGSSEERRVAEGLSSEQDQRDPANATPEQEEPVEPIQ